MSLISLPTHYFINTQLNANTLSSSETIHYNSLSHCRGLVGQTDQGGYDGEI